MSLSHAAIVVSLEEPPLGTISPLLHGHFAEHLGRCVYGGLWTGTALDTQVIDALKRIAPPVLRWPGGCFADDYHWEDGVGPPASRPRTVNIHWGQTVEDNSFGTHEFLALCRALGAEPYLAGNVGSGTPAEMRNWVEYCNFAGDSTRARQRAENGSPEPFGVRWWGVGNENWGCGGDMSPEDYATQYKRFAGFLRDYSGTALQLVACGPSGPDYEWTRRFFVQLRNYGWPRLHAFAAHFYCGSAGTATEYTEAQWYELLSRSRQMEPLIRRHRAIMDGFDPERKVGLLVDEWGTWHPAAPGTNPAFLSQQNTIRDALVAAMTLDIFHNLADAVVMANIAQFVNVLQAMVLTDGDRMLLTPTYHVFALYQAHRGGGALRVRFDAESVEGVPALSGSASLKEDHLTLSVVNAHASQPIEAALDLRGAALTEATSSVLAADSIHAHNTFENPARVQPVARPLADTRRLRFPPASVTVIRGRRK